MARAECRADAGAIAAQPEPTAEERITPSRKTHPWKPAAKNAGHNGLASMAPSVVYFHELNCKYSTQSQHISTTIHSGEAEARPLQVWVSGLGLQ